METNTLFRTELLQVADAVAREKGIEAAEVIEAMEQAIQKAGRAKYGQEHDIRAEIDRKTGEIRLRRFLTVADPSRRRRPSKSLCRKSATPSARVSSRSTRTGPARSLTAS
jgi:hypothetical protein